MVDTEKQFRPGAVKKIIIEVFMKQKVWFFLLIILAVMICSCGYRFTGEGDFPSQVQSIFIPVFENRTAETGIENVVTNDFIYEMTRSRKVSVVEREVADAVLLGVITSVNTQTMSRSGTQMPLERRVRMFLDVKLTDRQGKVLWASRGFSDEESFQVSPDKFSTEQRKRIAINTLSKRMAEMVYYQLINIE
jgi:outer membrane lipopolysaccharide assembly protein LptE/RlpB